MIQTILLDDQALKYFFACSSIIYTENLERRFSPFVIPARKWDGETFEKNSSYQTYDFDKYRSDFVFQVRYFKKVKSNNLNVFT